MDRDLAYKFTDRDVRTDPRLIRAAYGYLTTYTGEFEFLRDVKNDYLRDGTLGVAAVRGVLNCMRHHKDGQQWLAFWDAPTHAHVTLAAHRNSRRVVSPMRPAYIIPRHKFNAMFLVSKHPQAYIAHLIDPDRSELRWWTIGQFMELKLISICGRELAYGVLSLTDQGRDICAPCQLG